MSIHDVSGSFENGGILAPPHPKPWVTFLFLFFIFPITGGEGAGGTPAGGRGAHHHRRHHRHCLRCRFCAWFAWFAWSCAQSLAILVWFLVLVLLLLSCLDVVRRVALARIDRLARRIELGLEPLDRLLRGLDLLLRGPCLILTKIMLKALMTIFLLVQITSKKEAVPTTVLWLLQPLVALFVQPFRDLELLTVLALAPEFTFRAFVFCAGLLCLNPLGDHVVRLGRLATSSVRHVAGSALGAVLQESRKVFKKLNK